MKFLTLKSRSVEMESMTSESNVTFPKNPAKAAKIPEKMENHIPDKCSIHFQALKDALKTHFNR